MEEEIREELENTGQSSDSSAEESFDSAADLEEVGTDSDLETEEELIINGDTSFTVDELRYLISKFDELDSEEVLTDEEELFHNEEVVTSDNEYLRLIYEYITLEEEEEEELGIMEKPIVDYSIQESFMLFVPIGFLIIGIIWTIKKGIPNIWR